MRESGDGADKARRGLRGSAPRIALRAAGGKGRTATGGPRCSRTRRPRRRHAARAGGINGPAVPEAAPCASFWRGAGGARGEKNSNKDKNNSGKGDNPRDNGGAAPNRTHAPKKKKTQQGEKGGKNKDGEKVAGREEEERRGERRRAEEGREGGKEGGRRAAPRRGAGGGGRGPGGGAE